MNANSLTVESVCRTDAVVFHYLLLFRFPQVCRWCFTPREVLPIYMDVGRPCFTHSRPPKLSPFADNPTLTQPQRSLLLEQTTRSPSSSMDGRESGQCPRYELYGGVCGCPEFWQLADSLREDRASSFGVTSTSSYGLSALDSPVTSSVNSIPLTHRTRAPQITPAPPGPIKDTCFFWYHGTCRRGRGCDRPHEVHPTWPISPPPNYRHFQPCTLPLCPLRTDMPAVTNNQDNQRHGATTAGENSKDTSFEKGDTDTTEPEDLRPIPPTQKTSGAIETVQRGVGHQVLFTCKVEGRSEGKNELDELDYIDLSQLPCLPSTSPAQQDDIFSISHVGTLAKRPRSPATNLYRGNDKRVKMEDRSSSDLSALHTCDTPDSSRTGALPLICFYYYHKGYCNPKRGRRCDYLHDTSTSQQTVSLPYGIDNHTPACDLPLCPVRLRGLPELHTVLTQPGIESKPATPPRSRGSASLDSPDRSLRDNLEVVRSRPLHETLDQPLPQLTGPARQRYEEHHHSAEDVQAQKDTEAKKDTAPVNDVSLREQRTDKKGKNKRRRRRPRSARERIRLQKEKQETIQRQSKETSEALVQQRPLPLFASEQTPDSASSLPTSTLADEQITNHKATDGELLPAVDPRRANNVSNKVPSGPLPVAAHLQSTSRAVPMSQQEPGFSIISEKKQMSALGVLERTVASEGAHRQPQGDHHGSGVDAVRHRLPEGGQHLDCNTNVVRRFFEEFG